ncbi:MAG TPA: porin family protein [Terracidiphilus sp.]
MATKACGQRLEIGVRGAARLTSQLEGNGVSESRPYLVGPVVQANLGHGLAVEADALYSRFGYTTSSRDIVGDLYTSRDRANSWQFPLLLKYRFRSVGQRLYVLVGWDPEHATGTTRTNALVVSNPYDPSYTITYRQYSVDDNYGTNHGLVAGGGIELGSRHFRVSPEFRYVRWKNCMFSIYQGQGSYLAVPQNELQLLLGLTRR